MYEAKLCNHDRPKKVSTATIAAFAQLASLMPKPASRIILCNDCCKSSALQLLTLQLNAHLCHWQRKLLDMAILWPHVNAVIASVSCLFALQKGQF